MSTIITRTKTATSTEQVENQHLHRQSRRHQQHHNNNNNYTNNNSGGGNNKMTTKKQQTKLPNATTTSNSLIKRSFRATWKVKASDGALNTSNPIREIIETMNLAENPKKKVIPLSIGDPTIFGNLKPCHEILSALQEANNSGKYYGYQMAAGMETARDAVADYHFRCTGNKVKRQDVILASGCSHAIDLSICVLAQSGQNILIPRPGFPLYKTLTSVYGIEFKQYDLIAEKNWSIDLKHLESLIDDKTAAIVINNPSNPCGSVFSERHLLQILHLAESYCLPIIADEIYDKFVFSPEFYPKAASKRPARKESSASNKTVDSRRYSNGSNNLENEQPTSMSDTTYGANADDNCSSCLKDSTAKLTSYNGGVADENPLFEVEEEADYNDGLSYVPFISLSSLSKTVPILTCGGISKTCLIPGVRLGWIIINDRANIFDGSVRNGLSRLTQRLMGPNSLVQGALHDILTNVPDLFYKQTMDFIFKNAKLCYERLKTIKGLQPYMPQGSMYLMVKFNANSFPDIDGDLDFTSKLMNEESVLVLPGKCFDFPNYFRICLTVPTNVMEEALVRITEFCERHYYCSQNFKNDDSSINEENELLMTRKNCLSISNQNNQVSESIHSNGFDTPAKATIRTITMNSNNANHELMTSSDSSNDKQAQQLTLKQMNSTLRPQAIDTNARSKQQ